MRSTSGGYDSTHRPPTSQRYPRLYSRCPFVFSAHLCSSDSLRELLSPLHLYCLGFTTLPVPRSHTMSSVRYDLQYHISAPHLNPFPGDDVVDPDWENIPYNPEDRDSQELIPRGKHPVMKNTDNRSQRHEAWHENDHEYYTQLDVTLLGACMKNYPIFLAMVNWTVSRSSYRRGRFTVWFVPALQ